MERTSCKICILGYHKVSDVIRKALHLMGEEAREITVADCNINNLAEIVRAQQIAGCDIFIAGSGNAAEFRRVSQMPMVELRISNLDYLIGLHKALTLGRAPAFVKHRHTHAIPAELFSSMVGRDIPIYSYEDSFELQKIVEREDVDVIIGAAYPVELANAVGKAGVLVTPSIETIQETIRRARRSVEINRERAKQRQLFNGVVEQAGAGIIVTDASGRIIVFNSAAQQLTGVSRAQVIGQPLGQVLPPLGEIAPTADQGANQEGRRLMNGTMVHYRSRMLSAQGEPFARVYFLDIDNRRGGEKRSVRMNRKCWDNLVATSPAMEACVQKARQLAGVSGNLCILGEKDTDRGGLAEALFNASARSGEPLMELDVSLLSPESARAYLIGQEDIHGVTRGILELANGGGVILRNYRQAPAQVQSIIEAVAAGQRVLRVNGRVPFSLDVQFMVIGGTEDAKWLSEKYHLSTFMLDVPPLSQRREDVAALFVQKAAARKQLSAAGQRRLLTDKMRQILQSYTWPGNLAELERAVCRYLASLDQAAHPTPRAKGILLVQAIGEEELLRSFVDEHPVLHTPPDSTTLAQYQEAVETLKELYYVSNEQVARALQISRVTLWRYLNA